MGRHMHWAARSGMTRSKNLAVTCPIEGSVTKGSHQSAETQSKVNGPRWSLHRFSIVQNIASWMCMGLLHAVPSQQKRYNNRKHIFQKAMHNRKRQERRKIGPSKSRRPAPAAWEEIVSTAPQRPMIRFRPRQAYNAIAKPTAATAPVPSPPTT